MLDERFRKHLELIKDLVFTPGVSGWEDPVREKIRSKVSKHGETKVDALGNLTLTLGKGPKHAIFVAHMDEIGLVVRHIEDNGYIRVRIVGGLDERVLVGRVVDIYVEGKPEPVPGVIGLKPPHLMKDRERETSQVVKAEDILVDVGTRSRAETEALGISKLTPIILRKHFCVLANDLVATRGLDDRLGCAALIEALELIDPAALGIKVTFAWSVQEELGLRGAYALGNTLHPDYAIAIDSCTTGDSPQVEFHLSAVKPGEGPALRVYDRVAFASRIMMKHITQTARVNDIPLQVAVTGGTTDGAALQTFGAAMMALAVPVRYVHSPTEVMSLRDYDHLVKLIALVATEIANWPQTG
ncbi:MAG TPA: M42 family metallopeptidase [bacterium]|nr:M42 family metallopeptidase [bacterium]